MSKKSEELKNQETRKDIFRENQHASSSSEDEDINKQDICGKEEEGPPKSTEKNKESTLEYFMRKLSLGVSEEKLQEPATFESVIKGLKENKFQNVVTMVGAGISTAAGIPDFRSPGSGLYHNLKKYNLPYPQAIFELGYFCEHPEPFFQLAKELLPGTFSPTKAHYFIKLLHEKGILLRHYTQNIDNLERMAGLPEDKLIEAHGTFYTSHCLDCRKSYTLEWMKTMILATIVPRCVECDGVVKPDIIFFGETLPRKFFEGIGSDFKKCDLLIIMGSSLAVDPFASLVTRVSNSCPRLILNKHPVGINQGICYEKQGISRDVFIEGTCDFGCQKIADELGWSEELAKLAKVSTSTAT